MEVDGMVLWITMFHYEQVVNLLISCSVPQT